VASLEPTVGDKLSVLLYSSIYMPYTSTHVKILKQKALAGGTLVTIRGDGFVPSANYRCRFQSRRRGAPGLNIAATFVSAQVLSLLALLVQKYKY
jgi:hypothetical protein